MTADRLRAGAVLAALLGLGVSAYLTYVHYAGIEPICAASGRLREGAELELRGRGRRTRGPARA